MKFLCSLSSVKFAAWQICDVVRQGADIFWIEEQQVPFAVLGDQWVSFDDDNSLINKVVTCLGFTAHLLANQPELVNVIINVNMRFIMPPITKRTWVHYIVHGIQS